MLVYLGWIVAAFLGGFLLAMWQRKTHHSLRTNFARVEVFAGRSYREIVTIAGAKPDTITQQTDGDTLKTWQEGDYFITLAFDSRDICRGVEDERI